MTVVLLATRNAGKLRELVPLLAEGGWRAETLHEAGVPETAEEEALEVGETFAANALAKARHFASVCGRLVLADDSGLVVDALDGAPGVRSKRWTGVDGVSGAALDAVNNAHLLARLEAVGAMAPARRRARYVCAAAAAWPGGALVTEGETAGRILAVAEGAGGFGYDPLFWSEELEAGFGTVPREAKGAVSHRGRAFRALLGQLRAGLGDGAPWAPRDG